MKIGVLRVVLMLGESFSLKDKRRILTRLRDRLRKKFNISIARSGDDRKWNRAEIWVATLSNSTSHLNSCLDRILDHIENEKRLMVLDHSIEML